MRIVIIEDSDPDADLVQDLIMRAQADDEMIEVARFSKLQRGLADIELRGADVVLLDLQLPDSNYEDTMVSFRAKFEKIPVVVMTSMRDPQLWEQQQQLGIDALFFKGTDAVGDMLLGAIEKAVRAAGMRGISSDKVDRILEDLKTVRENMEAMRAKIALAENS